MRSFPCFLLLFFVLDAHATPPSDIDEIERVEREMGVYLVQSPRRHTSEKVTISRGRAVVDIWHPVHLMSDEEIKTRAVQWLIFGRTQYASGASGIFEGNPAIRSVTLRFHEVIRPGGNTRRQRGRERIKRYLAIRISRTDLENIDLAPIKECGARGDCSSAFRTMFTRVSFDGRYTRKRRREA